MVKSLRLALATRCLGRPIGEALPLASRLGAAGVQLDARNELAPAELSATGRRQFLHILDEVGLSVASFDFPLRRPVWDSDRLDARIDALKKTMEFGYPLKARVLTARLGGLPDSADAAAGDRLKAVLSDLAGHGNRVGVTLALGITREPLARVLEILRDISTGPIGVNFDPAALVAHGLAPAESLRLLGPFAAHVLVRDSLRDAGAGGEVPVGRGDVAWDELLAVLDEIGYRGWLTVDRTQGEDRAGDAGRAIAYLQSVWMG